MDNEKKDKNNSKQILLSVLGVAILIVAVVGISFAAFSYSKAGQTENTINTGTVTMAYTENENGINIENAVPMTAAQGKELTGEGNVFDFTVDATIAGTTTINYEVVAVKGNDSTIPDANIRLYLEKSSTGADGSYTAVAEPVQFTPSTAVSTLGAPVGTMQLATGEFVSEGSLAKTTHYYRLRMWVDTSYTVTGVAATYKVTVNVYGKGTN